MLVAPLAGAWIEISLSQFIKQTGNAPVAPLAGAWIEMKPAGTVPINACVAPLAGAWIEILIFIR